MTFRPVDIFEGTTVAWLSPVALITTYPAQDTAQEQLLSLAGSVLSAQGAGEVSQLLFSCAHIIVGRVTPHFTMHHHP